MEKIYLIEQGYDWLDGTEKEWSTIYGVRDYQEMVKDIKRMITQEREDRKIRAETHQKLMYKVYFRIKKINLY